MRTTKQKFNAINSLTMISKKLEGSKFKIVSLYSEEMKRIQNLEDQPLEIQKDEQDRMMTENIQQLSSFLKSDPLETLLFVAIFSVQNINSCNVDCRDLSRFLDINTMDFLPLKGSIFSLHKKGLIQNTGRRREDEYHVSKAAELALFENMPLKKIKAPKIDRYDFCLHISTLIENRSNEEMSTDDLFQLVCKEEEAQKHLLFIQNLTKLLPDVEDRTLFYEICDDYVRNRRHRNTDIQCTLDDIYDSMNSKLKMARSIMNKENALLTAELATLLPAQFFGEAEITLTNKGKQLIFEEDYELFNMKGGSDHRLISPDQIPDRKLFFNDELARDINFVKDSLQEDNFKALQKRLKENALPQGVAVLFHGLPGTGKTAVANMIAKATGRSVYHVDIAASKTCWFGESEKLFKKIFTDYRQMCENEQVKPILLFNEADALFSKRRDVNSGNCAQTENALQNILLEEMEKLDGILIATTNLCDNFDDAFERRFLFKIKFGKPSKEAKKAIWQSKLPWLAEEDCGKLASQYELSGGEIDNIVRKALMEEVLHGTRPDLKTLEAWCRGEKLSNGKCTTIGFNN